MAGGPLVDTSTLPTGRARIARGGESTAFSCIVVPSVAGTSHGAVGAVSRLVKT